MEGGEFSLSGSCMPSAGLGDASLKPSDLNGHELIRGVDDKPVQEVLVEAAQAGGRGEGFCSTPPVLGDGQGLEVVKGKKRGRPRRDVPRLTPPKHLKDEEDVCFICFDGGNLVLCDRRGCPKAYHPACVKRDDTFFRAKSKWNCGWHICSTCEKPAHYMCYTCTYSQCKKCSKGADFLCVRETKGFCSLCIKTIRLIENKDQTESNKIDFDDKTSWEYLFKMYWLYTKGKLSLSLDEITKATNLMKTAETSTRQEKDAVSRSNNGKGHISDVNYESKDQVVNRLRSNKSNQKSLFTVSPSINQSGSTDLCASVAGSVKWASNELLAFIAHVKGGDKSEISPHDAHVLLLDYVQRNGLWDPNQKSQILCDTRLAKLFGKPRVGHLEMLKLLEFHFTMKNDSPKEFSQCNINPVIVNKAEGNGSNDLFLRSNDKKRKHFVRGEDQGMSTDLSEYAAIDVHNISLIYLRRRLLENLVNNIEKFHEKVVGSIVRIRFSGCDQKQELFGLVQVIGTCKVPIPYKIGEKEKMVDVVLEIFNMDKKETISLDAVSDEKFSVEECRRLKESIKCGLVKHLTVGLIQEKAKALREVIVNDCLETEVLQLNRLRDAANENGHENMLREYVERLEFLKSPEEIERRLNEAPQVHIDPSLNPNNKSAEHAEEVGEKRAVKHLKKEHPVLNKSEVESIPSMNAEGSSKSTANNLGKIGHPTSVLQGLDKCSPNAEDERPGSRVVDSSGSAVGGCSSPAVISSASFSGVVSENSTGSPPFLHTNENENFWRYRDQDGILQGPFSLSKLRKWYTNALLPLEMRTWSIYDNEIDSLLLSDVLKGQQSQKLSSRQSSISLPSQGVSENGSNSGLTSAILDKWAATTPTYQCVDINKTSSPGWDSHKAMVHSEPSRNEPTNNPLAAKLDLNSDIQIKPCEDRAQGEEIEFQLPGSVPDVEEVDNNTILVPASDMNTWLQMLTEPIEFNTIDEESVSDLLDQVDAMESRVGVDFPSTSMNNFDYLFDDLNSEPENIKFVPPESSSSTIDLTGMTPQLNVPLTMNMTGMTPQLNVPSTMNNTAPNPIGQYAEVCEFYGRGQCMKGAFCEYLHQ